MINFLKSIDQSKQGTLRFAFPTISLQDEHLCSLFFKQGIKKGTQHRKKNKNKSKRSKNMI